AGRALAARFASAHARLLSGGSRTERARRTRDGLWLLERRVRAGAAAWLFDDLPFARVDEVAADALGVTLRALLRRPAAPLPAPRPASRPTRAIPSPADDRIAATLLAVARSNGRIAPAARALGVHRNTVLYRLRAARAEQGVDPRRPEDALRILSEADRWRA
ncbi:MAG: helix-turn-helix domain-containing protein, partial [Chloroflexota bacterium]